MNFNCKISILNSGSAADASYHAQKARHELETMRANILRANTLQVQALRAEALKIQALRVDVLQSQNLGVDFLQAQILGIDNQRL